jgi:signal transduction histidine kinase/ActR/RegA family two-component response regulator
MKMGGIRSRMLVAALLPVTLIAVLLAGVFLATRLSDLGAAHAQRARSLARQLAAASEYGLFSANVTHLQMIASGALLESDVRSVAILNAQGYVLASTGQPMRTMRPMLDGQENEGFNPVSQTDLLSQPIVTTQLQLDDLFESSAIEHDAKPKLQGHVLIEFSRDALNQRERDMWTLGFGVTLTGLLLGAYLALRLGQGVVRPIMRVSNVIERIGRGDLSVRVQLQPDDPLHDLQVGLNQMAERLESGRDELEQRVTAATHALREKKEEAETATLAKSRFLAAASHDLRQPTHALGMFVARLAQLPHDEQTLHLIHKLDASVLAMQDLLDGLLDISRLEAQSVSVQLRPFPLAELFDQLRESLSVSAEDKGLRLRIRPSAVWLMSDPILLQRILLNLVANAVRYTRTGSVLVACRPSADGLHARLEVWDSGIGIDPEHQRDIFKEFYQVANAERDRSKGLGLGLNIVQRTVQLLGYRLQLNSCLGQGTRFSLQVPLMPLGAATERRQAPRVDAFEHLAGLHVLVIEDDILAQEGLVSLLESWGLEVCVAEGLSEALEHLNSGSALDLIVSDYRLRAGENGLAAIQQLRLVAGRAIPACLLSGNTDPGLMDACQEAGLTLLHKPVRPAKLRSLIRRLSSDHQGKVVDLP